MSEKSAPGKIVQGGKQLRGGSEKESVVTPFESPCLGKSGDESFAADSACIGSPPDFWSRKLALSHAPKWNESTDLEFVVPAVSSQQNYETIFYREQTMRFLLKVNIPVEAGNAAAKSGTMGSIIQSILDEAKPEAAYFSDDNGQRTGFIIVDLSDASQIPAIAEPWFLAFNASVSLHPVMIPAELAKAGPAIEKAVKKYG
jgi:hypothetical protein